MKKIFLFAIAAATMAVGCQKIQDLVRPDDKPVDEDSPVEIKFTTNLVNVETKAAVTELTPSHQLYIYGINNSQAEKSEIINVPANVVANVAESLDGTDPTGDLELDKAYFYNGTIDRYSFYGYYVDNAVDGTPAPDDEFKFDVEINGQQDILHAVAESDLNDSPTGDVWSAQSARASKNPNLKFEHQLSQFSFEVRNQGVAEITLKGLSLNTVNKGSFTVAARQNGTVGLVASTESADKDDLTLPMDDLELPKKPADNDNTYLKVGTIDEGVTTQTNIMVFPGVDYTLKMTVYQSGMLRTITWPLKLEQTTVAKSTVAGESYNVQITIYSLNEIAITASLVAWNSVVVDPIDTEDIPESDLDDDYNSVLSVNPSVVNMPAVDNSETTDVDELVAEVTVTKLDEDDVVTATEELDWVTVALKDGSSDTYVITVTANMGVARSGDVTFTSTKYGYSAKLKVNQAVGE